MPYLLRFSAEQRLRFHRERLPLKGKDTIKLHASLPYINTSDWRPGCLYLQTWKTSVGLTSFAQSVIADKQLLLEPILIP